MSVIFLPASQGPENGCANFMGTWHFSVLSAGKAPMPIKFLLVWAGGGGFGSGGGWKYQFYSCWRGDFSD